MAAGCSGKATDSSAAKATSGSTGIQPGSVNIGPRLTLANATKVDLLFDIDNSASMGDKQAICAQAIPDLMRAS